MIRSLMATTAALSVLLLNGCGEDSGGGGGTLDAERSAGSSRQGRLIDSPVTGLHYTTASLSGTTDEDGRFAYRHGETVAFHLGDPADASGPSLKLGEASGRDVVTPLELMNTDALDDRVVNLLRLLQTLDDDLDPGNGIRIDLGDGNLSDGPSALDLSLPIERFANDPSVLHLVGRVAGRDALVDVDAAVDHFQENLNELLGDPVGSWVLSEGSVRGESVEGLDASLSFDGAGRYSARARWPGGDVSVEAEFELDGLRLNSRVLDASIDAGASSRWSVTQAHGVPVDLGAAPIVPPGPALLASGTDAHVRLLANGLTLESPDGRIVLRYVRGDPAGDPPIAFVQVDPASVELTAIGAQTRPSAVAFDAASAEVAGTRFLWQSSDPSVVTVDGNGSIVAVGAGSATVSVGAAGAEASVRVDVVLAEPETGPGTDADAGPDADAEADVEAEAEAEADEEEAGTEAGDADADEPGGEDRCDEAGSSTARNEERVTQINESDVGQDRVEQRNTSTIDQSGGDGCTAATSDEVPTPTDAVCGVCDADGLQASTCAVCAACPRCAPCRACPPD